MCVCGGGVLGLQRSDVHCGIQICLTHSLPLFLSTLSLPLSCFPPLLSLPLFLALPFAWPHLSTISLPSLHPLFILITIFFPSLCNPDYLSSLSLCGIVLPISFLSFILSRSIIPHSSRCTRYFSSSSSHKTISSLALFNSSASCPEPSPVGSDCQHFVSCVSTFLPLNPWIYIKDLIWLLGALVNYWSALKLTSCEFLHTLQFTLAYLVCFVTNWIQYDALLPGQPWNCPPLLKMACWLRRWCPPADAEITVKQGENEFQTCCRWIPEGYRVEENSTTPNRA